MVLQTFHKLIPSIFGNCVPQGQRVQTVRVPGQRFEGDNPEGLIEVQTLRLSSKIRWSLLFLRHQQDSLLFARLPNFRHGQIVKVDSLYSFLINYPRGFLTGSLLTVLIFSIEIRSLASPEYRSSIFIRKLIHRIFSEIFITNSVAELLLQKREAHSNDLSLLEQNPANHFMEPKRTCIRVLIIWVGKWWFSVEG